MTQPYIGLTGIKTLGEAESLLAIYERLGFPQSHQLSLGYLVSYRGLARGTVANPQQYVLPTDVAGITIDDRRLFNVLHYNSRSERLRRQIESVTTNAPDIDGVQLNIGWPDPHELIRLRGRSWLRVILQISARSMAELGDDMGRLVERLKPYQGCVDDLLYDPSGGLGVDFSTEVALRFIDATGSLGFRLGVAGGLSGETIETKVGPLLTHWPELSFDAQSRLRDPNDWTLDVAGRCAAYLEASHHMMLAH